MIFGSTGSGLHAINGVDRAGWPLCFQCFFECFSFSHDKKTFPPFRMGTKLWDGENQTYPTSRPLHPYVRFSKQALAGGKVEGGRGCFSSNLTLHS